MRSRRQELPWSAFFDVDAVPPELCGLAKLVRHSGVSRGQVFRLPPVDAAFCALVGDEAHRPLILVHPDDYWSLWREFATDERFEQDLADVCEYHFALREAHLGV